MITKTIEHIIKDGDEVVRNPVNNDSGRRELRVIKTQAPQVRDEIIRIVDEGDPIGFLIAVMNGELVESHLVDKDGEVHSFHSTATLKDRIAIAKFLTNKYMPTVAVTKHMVSEKNADERNLRQIINVAASRGEG